ncbi:cytoplasmic membrane protein ImpL63 [Leptospira kmetyi]|uniref:Cytoplasmic membrane protein n=1 Tax=Leptospira kmetyi TaxID=408139 RepID=A0ABX4NCU7_9LEPT|nr:hypothetical protein [Leptospira kmetyi]PJZ29270.1 hypothetical protein CH378_13335 [Leptospira kmetyi]PJZ42889.1 hypothetical protein CH370_00090 [Leptospira kmetyi]TGK22546.1 hypothetical protein EHO62_01780 [Leptospira kmetyi]TGK27271.1 hypothetical protein EHO66_15270 [Leptospira kmetyi]TGL69169.1 hypothetical protein EHQ67_10050 [Leptospira kmetyi]
MTKRSKYLITFLFLFFAIQTGIQAQLWMPPGRQYMHPADPFTYDLGINKYQNDYYLYVAPTVNLNFGGDFGASLTVPLNFLMYDVDPKQENSKIGKLRSFDYNEKSDYLRVINNIWFGQFGKYTPGEITYSAYLGKMFDGYIGHGTIVNRYVNNQRLDVYNVGLQADMNSDFGGVQVFTNSIYSREVSSARVYIRPIAIGFKLFDIISGRSRLLSMLTVGQGNVADEAGRRKVYEEVGAEEKESYRALIEDQKTKEKKEEMIPAEKKPEKPQNLKELFNQDNFSNRFAIGYTTAFDNKAPLELKFDTTGRLKVDDNNNPLVRSTEKLTITGFDFEYKLLSSKYIELTPYYDVNKIKQIDNAKGTHYGAILRLGGKDIYLQVKPEYRNMSATYIPMYFDSFYELERYQSNLQSNIPQTKLEAAKLADPDAAKIKGYFTTVLFNFYRIAIESNYENYSGPNNSRIFVGVYVPLGTLVLLNGYYMKKGFDENKEAFKLDDRSQGALELAINLGFAAVRLQNVRKWVYDTASGQYQAQDEQKVLFSSNLTF